MNNEKEQKLSANPDPIVFFIALAAAAIVFFWVIVPMISQILGI